MTSLPVPLSPKRSTGAREREILVIWRRIWQTCGASPTNPCREPAIGDKVNRLNDIVALTELEIEPHYKRIAPFGSIGAKALDETGRPFLGRFGTDEHPPHFRIALS